MASLKIDAFIQLLANYWDARITEKWTQADLAAYSLPDICVRYLVEVGLPQLPDWTMRFASAAHSFVHLNDYKKTYQGKTIGKDEFGKPITGERLSKAVPTAMQKYLIIGFDDIDPICRSDRAVCSVSPDGFDEVFFNASIWQLGVCLYYFQKYRVAIRSASRKHPGKLADRLKKQIGEIDPTAMGSDEFLWPTVIEEIQYGLM